MKKALLLVALLLFSGYAFAYDDMNGCIGDGNFYSIGECVVVGAFSGSTTLFALILLLLFAITAWQLRVPMGVTIGLAAILSFALLAPGVEFENAELMLNLVILVTGALIGMGILKQMKQ